MARTPKTKPVAQHSGTPNRSSALSVTSTSTRRSSAFPSSSRDTVVDIDSELIEVKVPQIASLPSATEGQSETNAPPVRSSSSSESTLEDSLDIVGSKVKVLLHALNDLERHGIDAVGAIQLPKIALVGDQSSGKSSLLEGISEISVPRASSTCTRCVLHLNLRANNNSEERWICEATLIKKYTHDPDASKSEHPLYPWTTNAVPKQIPFGTIYHKDELEALIRLAQVATLNPETPPERFKGANHSDYSTTVQFSPNIISLNISGPNLPNLSFYDLPGVISQSYDGRKDTITLVDNLVREYISQENTLVLLAVPMECDIDNSKASGILNDADANERTIGVLTKPDRLQSEDRVDGWNAVLKGEAFRKGHGYYVVKQPTQQQLTNGITHAKARDEERAFFESNTWTNRFQGFEDKLGARNLQHAPSQKLADLILRSLPSVENKIQAKLGGIEKELEMLPDPPANALHVVNKALSDLTTLIRHKIDGEMQPNELSKAWKGIKKTFCDEIIQSQRPNLVLQVSRDDGNPFIASVPLPRKQTATPTKREAAPDSIYIASDSDDMPTPSAPKRRKGAQAAVPITPSKSKLATSTPMSNTPSRPVPIRDPAHKKRFTLSEIHTTLDEYSAYGLPDRVEPKAVDSLIGKTLENWHLPLHQLLVSLKAALQKTLQETLDEVVKGWRSTELYSEIYRIQEIFLDTHCGQLKDHDASRALRLERAKPISEDTRAMKRYRQEELEFLENAWFRRRSEDFFDTQDENTGKVTTPAQREAERQNKTEALKKKLGTDQYEREIKVMAEIRAYYQIASVRFVDHICQSVEAELFAKFRDGLHDDLEDGLRVTQKGCDDYAAKLLDDDPVRAQRRIELKDKKYRLEQAAIRLDELNQQFHPEDMMDI